MPLPKTEYRVDQFHDGRYIVAKMVNGVFEKEEGRYWDLEEAKKDALERQLWLIASTLFPWDTEETADDKTKELVKITRAYFQDLLRILPRNADADYARLLIRQAFSFARTAIVLDGMV
jgi:FAD/FMN-containing dehydrogenase